MNNMIKIMWTLCSLTMISIIPLQVLASDDDDSSSEKNGSKGGGNVLSRYFQRADFAPVNNPTYVDECGTCHMAYQAGMLPAASWRLIMAGLDNHFEDNAELDTAVEKKISTWLTSNAADKVDIGRSSGVAESLKGQAPLRFTETRYFTRKHHELSFASVKNNPEVGSFSRCEACHSQANKGNYDEDDVIIPGKGRWED